MKNIKSKKNALTLVELLVSVTIMVIMGLGIFSGFRYYKRTGKLATDTAVALARIRKSLDYMKNDIVIAKGLYSNDTSTIESTTSPSFSGTGALTTTANRLILEVPSIYNTGAFIDLYDEKCTDYIVYEVSNGDLIKTTYTSTETGSSRPSGTMTVCKNIYKIVFMDIGETDFSSLTVAQLDSLKAFLVIVQTTFMVDGNLEGEGLGMEICIRNAGS